MRRLVSVLLGALLLVAGCGEKKKSAHDKFTERADSICLSYGLALRQIPQPPDATAPVQVGPYLARFVPVLEKQNAQLGQLVPPPADATNMRRFLAAQDAQVTFANRARAAAERGRRMQMRIELGRWQAAIGQAAIIATELDIKQCGGAAGPTSAR